MLELIGPTSTQSTAFQLPQYFQRSLPLPQDPYGARSTYSRDSEKEECERAISDFSNPSRKFVSQWLASTASPRGVHTPPPEMNGGNLNGMLAPRYGGLYSNNQVGKQTFGPYQEKFVFYGDKTLAGTTQSVQKTASRPASPTSLEPSNDVYGNNSRRRSSTSENQIVSYLQIPSTINDSKGSLAEFAAQITCLFWFESSFTLHRVEESRITPLPTTPLVPEAIPTMGFRKWVTTILSTTQVTQNVILLALMFIYRLKKLNPTVKGKAGSEFRLLTVALMLGNKFLDDNTYTNKTWAEVSGISVQEIHIMEVEFLSNMKYTLYASEREWTLWHQKLGRFWNYFDKASKAPAESKSLGSAAAMFNLPPNLPSPPASIHASPPFSTIQTPNYPHPLSMPPYLAPSIPPPSVRMPEVDLRPSSRKRGFESEAPEQPTKKLAIRSKYPPAIASMIDAPRQNYMPTRLPIPNLSISTNGHPTMFQGQYSAHLPPPSSRATSEVYPQQWTPSGTLSTPSSHGSFNSLPPMESRRPTITSMTSSGSRNPSPTHSNFPQHNNDLSSPLETLQRNSPYKPLRAVNTLLVPPPSASMHNPSQHVGSTNMYYQPLGKPLSEKKTGVVPYMHTQWPHMQQTMQWPPLLGTSQHPQARY